MQNVLNATFVSLQNVVYPDWVWLCTTRTIDTHSDTQMSIVRRMTWYTSNCVKGYNGFCDDTHSPYICTNVEVKKV